jgi:hypothetical protein
MSRKRTYHYNGDNVTRRTESRNSDGSRRITESRRTKMPLGPDGWRVVRDTKIDKHGHSSTKQR